MYLLQNQRHFLKRGKKSYRLSQVNVLSHSTLRKKIVYSVTMYNKKRPPHPTPQKTHHVKVSHTIRNEIITIIFNFLIKATKWKSNYFTRKCKTKQFPNIIKQIVKIIMNKIEPYFHTTGFNFVHWLRTFDHHFSP